jgi:transcriptional regulator with XRE-family HTH domain
LSYLEKMMMKRGRPKGQSKDNRSFGPLGDLIRKHRLKRGMGLLDVAKACDCSVQFISNIEHGRAPLPWNKVDSLAKSLKVSKEDLQVANFTIRSDFQSIAGTSLGKRVKKPNVLKGMAGLTSSVAFALKDDELHDLIQKYQAAPASLRKKFVLTAFEMLATQ